MIIWAHGLEGSPQGAKVQALRAAGLVVHAPDGQGKVLQERLVDLVSLSAALADHRPVLAGSSYGGLAAAWLASQHPERFSGLLLCAPALHYREPPVPDGPLRAPLGLPTQVLHGVHDAVVPVSASRAYAAQSPHVHLIEVDDNHRLSASHARIVAMAEALLKG